MMLNDLRPLRHAITTAHFEAREEVEPESDLRLEAAPSNFDVARAVSAYIPMLVASYALAHEQPIAIPPGYEILGEIRADTTEVAEAGDSPEVATALANDIEATAAAVSDPSAFGFVVQEMATASVLVCIRGTQTPREWMANFTAVPNPFSLAPRFGLVHLGFERMHRKVRATIVRGLERVPSDARVTVVGHSLGGAMAILAAVDLIVNFNRQNVDVCTFGGPRVGKFIFRHRFNQVVRECYRVTNQGDVVPHVPPLLTGWSHVGDEIEVDGNLEHPHSLTSYLEGLKNLGTVREIATVTGEEAALIGVLSVRVP